MALERGFRRILIALSTTLLALGLIFDVMSVIPHATVEVTLKDGRTFTLERHARKAHLLDRDSLIRQLPPEALGPPVLLWDIEALKKFRQAYPQYRDIPDLELARRIRARADLNSKWRVTAGEFTPDPEVVKTRVIRGPSYWWWEDTGLTKVAAIFVALLWVAFYVVRWIVHGFARP
ncbi:MAG TPA: hypothetical protein VJO34_09685 [Methylomirabilota bacterium]|nr:hypothetical protein [Methylomirabilota bacterium]